MGAGVVVVDQPPPHQVLVVLDVLVEAGELNHLHDDKAGEQRDDKQGWVDASLHQDLKPLSDMMVFLSSHVVCWMYYGL